MSHDVEPGLRDARFGALPTMTYVAALLVLATLPTLMSPALVAAWQHQYHWTETQLGLLASADLIGLAAGSTSGLYWQSRWPWQKVAMIALVATVLLNLCCLLLDEFVSFLALRLLAGGGAGVLIAIYSAYLANARSAERFIAASTFAQIAAQGLALTGFGYIGARHEVSALFLVLGLSLVPLIPLRRLLPTAWPVDAEGIHPEQPVKSFAIGPGLFALAAFVPLNFFLAVYPFLPEFGRVFAGLDLSTATYLLGLSLLPSALGPAAAFITGERWGTARPLVASAGVCAVTIAVMATSAHSGWAYFVNVSLLQAAWCFMNCYFYAAVISVDSRLTVAATPLAAFSNALGAAIMGFALQRGGLSLLTASALVFLASATAMALWALGRSAGSAHTMKMDMAEATG